MNHVISRAIFICTWYSTNSYNFSAARTSSSDIFASGGRFLRENQDIVKTLL